MNSKNIRILHITDCYDAGVFASINTLVQSCNGFEHNLLYSGSGQVPENLFHHAKRFVRSSPIGRAIETWREISNFEGELIHLHSTRAGILGRLAVHKSPILYQPHGAHYLDLSVGRSLRLFSLLVEKLLATRTSGFLGVSNYETKELAKINKGVPAFLVTNAVESSKWPRNNSTGLHVVMNGRIHKVKDPEFFAETVKLVRLSEPGAKFTWIGDGDPRLKQVLINAGVEVTGWLDSPSVNRNLNTATVYFHSSMSDGLAFSILEAANLNLPIVARALAHFEGYDLDLAVDPSMAAETILRISRDSEFRFQSKAKSSKLSKLNTPAIRARQYKLAVRAVLAK